MLKQPPVKDKDWLAIVHRQPCCVCGRTPVQAHHPRVGSINDGKPYTGMAQKCSDRWAVALCNQHHYELHNNMGEREFWASYGIDPFAVAMSYSKPVPLNYRMP